MTGSDWWWPASHPRVAFSYASPSPPAVRPAANDDALTSDPLGVNEPAVVLVTFPDAILLTFDGDDDLADQWRRLFPLDQRAAAEQAAFELAECHGLPLRSDDLTDVRATHG